MTWTLLAIIAIAIIASLGFLGVRLGVLERRPVTYTQKERFAWAIAIAAIPMLGAINGGTEAYWVGGMILGVAVYFKGPEYYRYRLNRHV